MASIPDRSADGGGSGDRPEAGARRRMVRIARIAGRPFEWVWWVVKRVGGLALALLDLAKNQSDLRFAEETIRCFVARLMPSRQFREWDDELVDYAYLRLPEEKRAEIVSWLTHLLPMLGSEWLPMVRAWLVAIQHGDRPGRPPVDPSDLGAVPDVAVAGCGHGIAVLDGVDLDAVPFRAAAGASAGAVEIGRVHDDLFLVRGGADPSRAPLAFGRGEMAAFLDEIKRGGHRLLTVDNPDEEI